MEGHEIKSMLKPVEAATNAVVSWLESHNVTEIEDDSDWINFHTDVGTANKMLETQFYWYRSEYMNKERLRTLQYSVPGAVAEHITLLQPTTRFGELKPHGAQEIESQEMPASEAAKIMYKGAPGAIDPACNTTITPQCLLKLYNVHYGADPKTGVNIGFASFLEEYARYNDLDLFEENIAPYALGQNFSVVSINGGLNGQTSANDSGEANLDNQYIVGVGHPLPVTEFTTAGRGPLIPDLDQPTLSDNEDEPYLDYLQALVKMPNKKLPQVISHSYGENEQSVPVSYAKSVCNLIAQLGARGVTVIFSSGDSGVGSACLTNDGKNKTVFQPQYPASCPYVTSVGSTQFLDEEGTFFSSGGFSRIWSRPAYQEVAVRGYLKQLGGKFSEYINRNGRGFPDVATQGVRFSVYDKGVLKFYRGTSCSAPTFSAIVSLLNAARVKSHLKPFGFLNPWLYSVGQFGLNDIKKGGSTGCNGLARFMGPPNGSPVVPYASFNCTKGWDPVTGLGTPNFGKLLKLSTPWVKNTGGPVPA